MKEKIRPSSNIIDSIGKNLVIDEIAAIIELIKNSYDADAENVKITFSCFEKKMEINIEDDGNGMDFDIVKNSWMVPATSYKIKNKYSPNKKRRVLGEKGLGRFSVSILGNKLKLITIQDKKEIILDIDWNQIKAAEYLDEVEFEIFENITNKKSGTKLVIIKENFEVWSIKKKKNLEKELRKLLSPIEDKSDIFNIRICYQNFVIKDEKEKIEIINEEKEMEPFDLLEYYDYRLVGKVDKTGKGIYQIYSTNNVLEKEGELTTLNEELKEYGLFPGEFHVEFRFFNRDTKDIERLAQKLQKNNDDSFGKLEVRKLLNELSGVSIYKNKFRIRPYGEEAFDWLELNKRRFLNPTGRISNNQINGLVTISDKSYLKEKSARDGLQEDEYFYGLKYIVTKFIVELENRRTYEKSGKKDTKIDYSKEGKLFEKIGDFSNVKINIKEKLQKKWQIPQEGIKEIEEIIDKKQAEDLKEVQVVEEKVVMYQKHVTLGKIINKLLHEGRKPLSFFLNSCSFLKIKLKKYLENPQEDLKTELLYKIDRFKEETQNLNELFKSIEPLSAKKRGNRRSFNLGGVIKKALEYYDGELKNVNVHLELEENIMVNGYEGEVLAALANIFENSYYWVNLNTKDPKLEIKLYKTENNKIIIEIKDNGPGIENELIESGIIFEPGFSKKVDGYGLGLSIAGEALKRNGFILKAKESSHGACFIVEEENEIINS